MSLAVPALGPRQVPGQRSKTCPNSVLLEFVLRLARGSSLCAVESGAFRLSGWAAATSAVDLATGQRAEPLNNDLLELLDRRTCW